MKAIKIEGCTVSEVEIENTLEALQTAVDGYWVMKKRGSLTIEDIAQAINERSGEDRYFFMIDTNAPEGWYDNYNLNGDYEPKGDCVKVYSFDAMKRLTGAIK